jgi:hypothetical protein
LAKQLVPSKVFVPLLVAGTAAHVSHVLPQGRGGVEGGEWIALQLAAPVGALEPGERCPRTSEVGENIRAGESVHGAIVPPATSSFREIVEEPCERLEVEREHRMGIFTPSEE